MKKQVLRLAGVLCILLMAGCTATSSVSEEIMVAPKPPMGWNSYDAYDSAINEEQFKANVDVMAAELKDHGWEYAVIDYIWFSNCPGCHQFEGLRYGHPNMRFRADGSPVDTLVMDAYGRLLPAPNRFPSAAGGKGFKPLADYVHAKGLKFGIHIMRGIPRQAAFFDTPILDTDFTASMVAEPFDTCRWCNNMYGVDASKPGAQEYYNSLFNLYAEWEVDFIKADDMTATTYHAGEIEMMRKAIDQCGRPMVLSLSCGEAPISKADHVSKHANMWRISIDFWDRWEDLKWNFVLADMWSNYIRPNQWPDLDMIPIGRLSLGGRPRGPERESLLTWPEHYTLMSLWCIARSPLMIGGSLTESSEKSLAFFKNSEVLEVNQNSTNNRQVFRDWHREHTNIWLADIPGTEDHYLGLFNTADTVHTVTFWFELENMRDAYAIRDLWAKKDLGVFSEKFGMTLDPHGAGLYRMTKQ